jgi:hypothetical protein
LKVGLWNSEQMNLEGFRLKGDQSPHQLGWHVGIQNMARDGIGIALVLPQRIHAAQELVNELTRTHALNVDCVCDVKCHK